MTNQRNAEKAPDHTGNAAGVIETAVAEQTGTGGFGVGGHDEPVVVDNGPSTVLFGKIHEPTKVGELEWRRDCTGFHALLVQEENASGQVTAIDAWGLTSIDKVRVTMKDSTEFFEFTVPQASGEDKIVVLTSETGLTRESATGRLKFPETKPAVRVARIEGVAQGTTKIAHTVAGGTEHVKVTILMTPLKPKSAGSVSDPEV